MPRDKISTALSGQGYSYSPPSPLEQMLVKMAMAGIATQPGFVPGYEIPGLSGGLHRAPSGDLNFGDSQPQYGPYQSAVPGHSIEAIGDPGLKFWGMMEN